MFNQEQQNIIDSTESRIIINASAGTGKTHTLIGIANNNRFGSTVLITFTNKAANEMAARLYFKPYYVGTIHGFAKLQLLDLAKKHNFRIRILKESAVRKIIQLIFEENDFGVYVSSKLLDECYSSIISQSKDFDYRKTKLFYEVKKLYTKYKEQNKLYDGTDTPKYLLEKLIHYNENLNMDLLLVDEAQDLDDIQYKLIQRISKRVIAIGDPKQSIYMFRGAVEEVFNRFETDGYKRYNLTYNYRSKQEIINYAGADLIAVRGSGGEIIEDGTIFRYGPQILCRTNLEVESIKRFYPNVCTIHAAKGLEYNNVCVVNFPIEGEEDTNILFVALTRAKDRLAKLSISQILIIIKDMND